MSGGSMEVFCEFCVNRTSITKIDLLIASEVEEMKKSLAGEQPIESSSRGSCSVCYGILCKNYILSLKKQITCELQKEEWQFDSFSLCIIIPPLLLDNDVQIKKCASSEPSNFVESKYILRHLLIPLYEFILSKKYSKAGPLKINMEFKMVHVGTNPLLETEDGNLKELSSSKDGCLDQQQHGLETFPPESSVRSEFSEKMQPTILLTNLFATHDPIYLTGRYTKYSRKLYQTPWPHDIGQGSSRVLSIYDLIEKVLKPRFAFSDMKFSAAGREDVDVRMLGDGRPFIIEMINPHRTCYSEEELREIQNKINLDNVHMKIHNLTTCDSSMYKKLKEGENEKSKIYSALIVSKNPIPQNVIDEINQTKNLEIQQMTPFRVLHRRSALTRVRMIYWISISSLSHNPCQYVVRMNTQAGTYIKEFIHGEMRRTRPSLASLVSEQLDILRLDVEKLEIDW